MSKQRNTYCLAYYGDGEWLGWYYGTWGTVSDTPKLYTNLEGVQTTVVKNFYRKLNKVNTSCFEDEKEKVHGLAALALLVFSSQDLLKGKKVELRLVEAPFYEGQNPETKRWESVNCEEVSLWAEKEPTTFVKTWLFDPLNPDARTCTDEVTTA